MTNNEPKTEAERAVQEAIAKSDLRFLATQGRRTTFPGLDETADKMLIDHCGYRFPLMHVPMDEQPNFHDFHHEMFNCNYGMLTVLDRFHQTDLMYLRMKESAAKQKAEAVKVAQKVD